MPLEEALDHGYRWCAVTESSLGISDQCHAEQRLTAIDAAVSVLRNPLSAHRRAVRAAERSPAGTGVLFAPNGSSIPAEDTTRSGVNAGQAHTLEIPRDYRNASVSRWWAGR